MGTYTDIILTLLTIATGVLAILTFFNGRKKDAKNSGEEIGVVKQKVENIDKRTVEMQKDIREFRIAESLSAQRSIEALASAKSAHKRLDELANKVRNRNIG